MTMVKSVPSPISIAVKPVVAELSLPRKIQATARVSAWPTISGTAE
jgi:hypothetical protein